jgi:hypothetical protein
MGSGAQEAGCMSGLGWERGPASNEEANERTRERMNVSGLVRRDPSQHSFPLGHPRLPSFLSHGVPTHRVQEAALPLQHHHVQVDGPSEAARGDAEGPQVQGARLDEGRLQGLGGGVGDARGWVAHVDLYRSVYLSIYRLPPTRQAGSLPLISPCSNPRSGPPAPGPTPDAGARGGSPPRSPPAGPPAAARARAGRARPGVCENR